MPTNRVPLRRRVRGELTSDQEMALWLGVGRDGFPFADEDEARNLWERHRARLMALHAHNGRRPYAWWEFDAPRGARLRSGTPNNRRCSRLACSTRTSARSLLHGGASSSSGATRRAFSMCVGPNVPWLTGRAARLAHLAWADVPGLLGREVGGATRASAWSAERKPRPKGSRGGARRRGDARTITPEPPRCQLPPTC